MVNKKDRLKAGLRPLMAKTLENALSHRIAKEFPRIGGPRICKLCAEMIMEVVNNNIRSKDHVHHGQIVWTAVGIDHPPGINKKRWKIRGWLLWFLMPARLKIFNLV